MPARKLRLRFSERSLLLAAGDLTMFAMAFLAYLGVRFGAETAASQLAGNGHWFATLGLAWILAVVITDGWDLNKAAFFSRSQWAACSTVLLASLIFFMIPVLTPGLPSRRMHFLVIPVVGCVLLSVWRLVVAHTFNVHRMLQRALVIGAGDAGTNIIEELVERYGHSEFPGRFAGHWMMGFVDDDPAKCHKWVHGVPVLGKSADLLALVRKHEVDEIVLAITHSQTIGTGLFQSILTCREQGVQVSTMSSFLEELTERVPVEHAGSNLGVVMPMDSPMAPILWRLTKRLVDILVGAMGCLLTVVVAPFIWLANRLTSPGPLLYKQQRVGHRGGVFDIYKFRSMVADAEERTGGAVWARENDDRITPAGRFLRKTRLDELPQFWNVLAGTMSFIGPRPERPEFVHQLAQAIPFYRIRHAVKPGITGWAQVRYRYGASTEDSLKKLQYDLYYIKRQSFFLDWRVFLRTIMVVLGFQGR